MANCDWKTGKKKSLQWFIRYWHAPYILILVLEFRKWHILDLEFWLLKRHDPFAVPPRRRRSTPTIVDCMQDIWPQLCPQGVMKHTCFVKNGCHAAWTRESRRRFGLKKRERKWRAVGARKKERKGDIKEERREGRKDHAAKSVEREEKNAFAFPSLSSNS